MNRKRLILGLSVVLLSLAATRTPWENLTEADWIYSLATRFALVDGHRIHYPTPTAELAKLLEGRKETAALRHLAEARLSLGDRAGALKALEQWAAAEGPAAWDEAARWAAAHHEMPSAFAFAAKALPGLAPEARKALASLRIQWAEAHPDAADPLAMLQARSQLFPEDAEAQERWVRALERADRLPEADRALASGQLPRERALLLRADLQASHGNPAAAFKALDEAADEVFTMDFRRAYAARAAKGAPTGPGGWRQTLEARFDGAALVRLATLFQGQGRGDAALDLLRQMDRRYGPGLDRAGQILLARLFAEIDAVPEAFRARLAAAQLGNPAEQNLDLAALAHLSLQAGSRPLPWGAFNDEAYKWAARVDRTPGFWTGGLSFLLTGQDWKEPLEQLERESLPDRTFAAARALAEELQRRNPAHPELAALRVALMARHVERGEGQEALALLPKVETAAPLQADAARRLALLAGRQVDLPLAEETRLYKARLKFAAADGARPAPGGESYQAHEDYEGEGEAEGNGDEDAEPRPWARPRHVPSETASYGTLLEEAIARLEARDPSHLAALGLMLGELDRLPDAEALWMSLATRLEGWSLDDELGPRYERALKRFDGPGVWDKLARWYARRDRHTELKRLAEDVAARFEATEIFRKTEGSSAAFAAPDQPTVGGRARMVDWADWVRWKALQRFPHSPMVFREAERLVTQGQWARNYAATESWDARNPHRTFRVVIPDDLRETRRWAILFADAAQREDWFAQAMRQGSLEGTLRALEVRSDRTPVEDLLLFEGWSRLSRFEQAAPAADRLSSAYPGDGKLAQRVLSLHRSLNGLESSHGAQATALVLRAAPALEDPSTLWTELGEMEEERGRPGAALEVWKRILEREPRDPKLVADLATLLWDYNHDREALAVVEEGRRSMDRPRFFAFETGVLRENVKDLEGAVREYLDALRPEGAQGYRWFEEDQRALRRLEQLLAREKVFRVVARRIAGLTPGSAEDERALAAFLPLATIQPPAPGLAWDSDQWIDGMDLPNDPVGRAGRAETRATQRPSEYDAVRRMGEVLLEKGAAMIPQATSLDFLETLEGWSRPLIERGWEAPRRVEFRNAVMTRQAALAPSEEERIRQEMARADFLSGQGRGADADQLWARLELRIQALPVGAVRLRAEAGRAAYLERAKGAEAAQQEWRRITARHPWSLGLLEDRLAFLARTGHGEEGRVLLESVVPKAAAGHKEALLDRLTQDCLQAGDTPRARRALALLLAQPGMEEEKRLPALHLLARLSFKEDPAWDAQAFAKEEATRLPSGLDADLYQQLALAADVERAQTQVPGLWIEALNRRTDRAWLASASRSARRAGKGEALLGFFEKQHQRSPRDVRWAVAVRDLRRDFHQVEGALAAAKAAVAIRPEREDLWREAAELLVRADRVKEAADFLEGWQRPRAADESVAGWRSRLYAQCGEEAAAFAVEQEALSAYAKEVPQDQEGLAQRRARAAERLLAQGLPESALRLCSARSSVRDLKDTEVDERTEARLALLVNQFPQLLEDRAEDEKLLRAAANVLSSHGRFEQREEAQAFLMRKLAPGRELVDGQALDNWWPFITQAGLEPQISLALARRLLAQRPGPWQSTGGIPFALEVSQRIVASEYRGQSHWWVFREPDLWGLWARDLARRDRSEELLAFLEPRWRELVAEARGPGFLNEKSSRQAWTRWMDDPMVLNAWARAVARHPGKLAELTEMMSQRHLWDRFWVLGARGWSAPALVALLPQEARLAWLRFWEALPLDPVLALRHRSVERVSVALERLLKGEPGAAQDPLIVKLRGPRTVGDVLGQEARWIWPEFTPRRDAKGEIQEAGDHRVAGFGVEANRVPGPLWGERPGEAWYVLEALARHRDGDATAPLLPLDVPRRGSETSRTLLALRLARARKDYALALALEAQRPGPRLDRSWLEGRMTLFNEAGKKDKALAALRAFASALQPRMTEEDFRWLSGRAEEAGVASPLSLLDATKPVGPAFLAYLRDRRPELADRFRTGDPSGYRAALAMRWGAREPELSAAQIRAWLKELWVLDSAALPDLKALGEPWPSAAPWLGRLPVKERLEALEALEQALAGAVSSRPSPRTKDPAPAGEAAPRFFTLVSGEGGLEEDRLLALRVRLARGEAKEALGLAEAMAAEVRRGGATAGYGEGDPLVARLRAWLAPFRDAKQAAPMEALCATLLREARQEEAPSVAAWAFAFELAPGAGRPALHQELEAAWFRGEVSPSFLGELAKVLVKALPSEAPRWMARWPREHAFAQTKARAELYETLKQPLEGAKALFEGRRRALWETSQEVQAFDLWRRLGGVQSPGMKAPAYWAGALPGWQAKTEAALGVLQARLRAHGHDLLSARAALRSPSAADEDLVARAALALRRGRHKDASSGDERLLRLRAARALLKQSPLAAHQALAGESAEEAARMLSERRFRAGEIHQALADLARIAKGAGNEGALAQALRVLADRNAPELKALRAELAIPASTPAPLHQAGGRPTLLRPRDLTWSHVAQVLMAEGVR